MKLKKYHDILGNPINPGDYIVYGAAKGRCAGLNIGLVLSTDKVKDIWDRTSLKVKANAVVEYFGDYRTAGLTDYGTEPKKPRTVTLTFSERICVVPAAIVPDAIKAMLNYGEAAK